MKDRHDESLIEQMINGLNNDNDSFDGYRKDEAHKIKAFIDMLPGGFLIYKAHGNEEIIYANRALVRIFKCDTLREFKELTGNSFKGVVYHEDLDEVEASIAEQIERSQDDLDYVEYRIQCKDGSMRWVEDYGHYIRTSSLGDIFYVFISEATEKINRRNAERAELIKEKIEKEAKLISLIEEYDKERKLIRQEHLRRLEVIEGLSVNYDSILYADLDANTVLAYRLSSRLNKQFDSKLQTREYMWFIDDYAKSWVHPDDKELFKEHLTPAYIRNKLAENRTFYLNFRCIQNGETKYLQLRLVDVGNCDRVSQIVMGYRCIDEEVLQGIKQKQLLEDALNNAKLAYVAKNTFLSNMSHDMRTPLNAIFGFTALARKNADGNGKITDYIDKIENAGKQILELVDKVLEISYIETQDFHINEVKCNVCDIAKSIYDTVLPQAQSKNIDISLHLDKVEHGAVYADEERLAQILLQLAGNAVKFTGRGGKISLTVEEQKSVSGEFATFRFIMKDTGVGIGKQSLQRIFEPFEREYNTTSSGVYGSGLGLTIAKYVIDMMGGNIDIDSEVGKGSTFTVRISFRLQDEGSHSASKTDGAEVAQVDLQGREVLLVEDNEINREIAVELLEELGMRVDTAENGKAAVEMVKKNGGRYSFVLMDIQMPVMDGRTAALEIRKLGGKAEKLPIIALSANAFESDKRQSLESGLNDHLSKPLDIDALIQTVSKLLKA